MSLALADVQRIAHLARLEIAESEAAATLAQLNDILAMIERMQLVDTSGVEPMAHPLGGDQRLRADCVTDSAERDQLLANAPAQEAGLFLVPRVVE